MRRRLRETGNPGEWWGEPPSLYREFRTDSRQVGEGDLFCAIRGTRVDGHRYLPEVAGAGAGAAVVEEVRTDVDLPQLAVDDTRSAAAHLASLSRGDPGEDLRLVGVTGTNGKTTTAWMTRHLLGAAGLRAGAVGTLGTVLPDGAIRKGELTTPGPLELMDALSELRAAGATAGAIEASSHALDQRRIDALHFDVGIFTTFGREHLEYHPDMATYRSAKLRLGELVREDGTCAVLAGEDAWETARFGDRRVVTYGLSEAADIRADELEPARSGIAFRLVEPAFSTRVRLPMPGRMNVSNALGAWTAARALGGDPSELATRLEDLPQIPGRFEILREDPPAVVRDYAHTPDAMERALETLRVGVRGRLLVVFGAGGDRDPGKRPLMGRAVSEGADHAFVTTDNPRSEDPAEICEQIVAAMPPERYSLVLDRREAIARAMAEAGPHDLVVLLGKGHETYQALGDRTVPFDEAAVVRELAPASDGPEES